MTRKRVRKLVQARLLRHDEEYAKHFRIKVRSAGGRCRVAVFKRPARPSLPSVSVLSVNGASWTECARQVSP